MNKGTAFRFLEFSGFGDKALLVPEANTGLGRLESCPFTC